jgi:PEP-CTERM motif
MYHRGLTMKFALKTALAGLALAGAVPTSAAIVSYNGTDYLPGQTITINFDGSSGGSAVAGLTSTLTLFFSSVDLTTGDYIFTYALTNTSSAALQPSSEVTAFGFNTNPNPDTAASSITSTAAVADDQLTNISSGSISNGTSVEICGTGGPNCAGGGSSGPDVGETSGGQFILAFMGGDPGTVTLTNPTVRYQSTGLNGGGSAIGTPTSNPPPPPPPPVVPEPATWAMMLLGFGAVGFALRRRRRTSISQLA